jgi:hypothetical protein
MQLEDTCICVLQIEIHFPLLLFPWNDLSNSMEHSPSWEANSHSYSQEIRRPLWNTKVYYCGHKDPPLIPILSQMKPVHTLPSYFFKIHFNIILLSVLSLPVVTSVMMENGTKCLSWCLMHAMLYHTQMMAPLWKQNHLKTCLGWIPSVMSL